MIRAVRKSARIARNLPQPIDNSVRIRLRGTHASPNGNAPEDTYSRLMRLLLLTSISTALVALPPTPKTLSIEPVNPLLFGQGATQALVVVAHYADGTEREITDQSQFSAARPAIASVDSAGVVTAHSSGGAPIHVTYKNLSATTTALIQRGEAPIPQSFNADI